MEQYTNKHDLFTVSLSDYDETPPCFLDTNDIFLSSPSQNRSNLISHYELDSVDGNKVSLRIFLSLYITPEQFKEHIVDKLTFLCFNNAKKHIIALKIVDFN